jgi:hypothetical protein
MVKHSSSYLGIRFGIIILTLAFIFGSAYNITAKGLPRLYTGVRPLGMGGAFTAVSDDENALFYNPAGLAKNFVVGDMEVVIPLPVPLIEISENSVDLFSDAQDTDFDDTGEVTDLLRKNVGKHQHLRLALFPSVGFQVANVGLQVGALGQATVDADIRNPAFPEAVTDIVIDYGLLVGAGMKLPWTGLSAGATLKALSRQSLNEVYTATDISDPNFGDRIDDDMKSGAGASIDIGVMYKLPFVPVVDTTAALVVQNIPEMDMGDAEDIKTQVNAGVAVEKSFVGFTLIGALDYLDIGNNIGEDDDWAKRLHLGAEVKLPTILSLRAGLNQGYWTAGATVDLWIIRFDVASYAEEVGAHAGQREDRRYVGQISFAW